MVCYLSFFAPLQFLILSRNPHGLPCLEGIVKSHYHRMLETVILDESQHYKALFTQLHRNHSVVYFNSLPHAPLDEVYDTFFVNTYID
jgi:hypothetical protein